MDCKVLAPVHVHLLLVGNCGLCGAMSVLQPAPAEPNRVQKKKLWEVVQPDLKTDADRVAGFKGLQMLTSAGPVTASTLAGANIS